MPGFAEILTDAESEAVLGYIRAFFDQAGSYPHELK